MANYKVRKYVNPLNPEEPKKFGVTNVSDGLIDKVEFASYISERSGVSVGHVRGLLADIEREIGQALINGETVDLSGIGLVGASLKSQGADAPEAFNVSMIVGVRAHLRLRKQFINDLKSIEFSKVKYTTATTVPVKDPGQEEPLP